MTASDIEEYASRHPNAIGGALPTILSAYLRQEPWQRLLDIGCGDGAALWQLHQQGLLTGRSAIAVDASSTRIARLKVILPDITAAVDDAETLATIPDGSVDFAISTQVIEHVDDKRMLQSLARVVRPGGLAYVSTVFKKSYAWYFYRRNGDWVLDPTHLREYRRDDELLAKLDAGCWTVEINSKEPLRYDLLDLLRKRISNDSSRKRLNGLALRVPIVGFAIWHLVLRRN